MKHTVCYDIKRITFTKTQMRRILKLAGIDGSQARLEPVIGWLSVELDAKDERAAGLVRAAREAMPECIIHSIHVVKYSRREMTTARLCEVWWLNKEIGEVVGHFGTKYELGEGCAVCGSRGYQIGPIRYPLSELKSKRPAELLRDGEIIVNRDVASAIAKLTGSWDDLLQIVDNKSGKKGAWWQLFPRHVMPPLDAEASGVDTSKVCKSCKRSCFTVDVAYPYEKPRPPPTFCMKATEVARLSDLAIGWELFGPDPRDLGETRVLYVSGRVAELMLSMRLRVKFVPVRFLER